MAIEAKDATLIDDQDMAEILLDAKVKLGEILKAIDPNIESSGRGKIEKRQSLPSDITKKQSHQAQTLAFNRNIVEQVKAKAREKGEIVTARNDDRQHDRHNHHERNQGCRGDPEAR